MRRLIKALLICLFLLLAGVMPGIFCNQSRSVIAAEAILQNIENKTPDLTPALTQGDIIYLKGLLDSRRKMQNLADDELRIIETTKKHLEGTKSVPVKQADREDLEERLKDLLRTEAASAPKERAPRMDLALFYLYTNQPDKAVRHLEIAGPGSEDNVFWPLLGSYAYLRLGEHKPAAAFLSKVQQTASNLMPLRIQRALFCSEFRTLGQYTPRTSQVFKKGERTDIYVEIIGSRFKKLGENKYIVDLTFDLEIRDEFQQVVWRQENYGGFSREYQNPVHDGFCDIVFIMPEMLEPGDYVLVLTCLDRASEKTDSADISFTIAGKKSRKDERE